MITTSLTCGWHRCMAAEEAESWFAQLVEVGEAKAVLEELGAVRAIDLHEVMVALRRMHLTECVPGARSSMRRTMSAWRPT